AAHVPGGIELGPGLLVDGVDVLAAEDPAEGQRPRITRREGLRVIGAGETPVRRTGSSIQRPTGAAALARQGLGDVLRRGLAVAFGPAQLAFELHVVGDLEVAVEVDERRGRRLVRAGDLVVDAVESPRGWREGGAREGAIGYRVARVGR